MRVFYARVPVPCSESFESHRLVREAQATSVTANETTNRGTAQSAAPIGLAHRSE